MSAQTYVFRQEDGTLETRHGAGYGRVWELCKACKGTGEEEGKFGPRACSSCGGRGETEVRKL